MSGADQKTMRRVYRPVDPRPTYDRRAMQLFPLGDGREVMLTRAEVESCHGAVIALLGLAVTVAEEEYRS